MSQIKEAIKTLSPDEQEQVQQYVTSIKEIKKKLFELLHKGKTNLAETGGNMSSGLILHDEE
jgi:hypothetical protein